MQSFTKGLIIGSIIGISASMMADSKSTREMKKRKVMKVGRRLLRNSGSVIDDVMNAFR